MDKPNPVREKQVTYKSKYSKYSDVEVIYTFLSSSQYALLKKKIITSSCLEK